MQFIQAKNYRKANRDPQSLLWIVIHSMEAPEKGSTAENVASWFAHPNHAPMASAHYCLDADSTVQCVRVEDIAFAAPGANEYGVHIELSGYARQTREEWLDPFGVAMLERLSALLAELSGLCAIPLVYADDEALKAELCGVTTHYDVTKAFKKSTHRDPGPGFPMNDVLARAIAIRAGV